MTNFKTKILLCLTAISISTAIHHPQVHEDNVEGSKSENTRIARNSESTYRTVHQPPTFSFEAAKQQDYLKVRYAEQQKMSGVAMVNGMGKSHRYLNQPQNKLYKTVQVKDDTNDWQPFDPTISKHNIRNVAGLHQFKTTKDAKLYKPSSLNVGIIPKDTKLTYLANSNSPYEGNKPTLDSSIIGSADLDVQGSENVEEKIDSRETQNEYSKIIFLNPDQLQDQIKQNSEDLGNSDASIKKPETQLTALNDLIGKNPNVQLEGLQRLLQDAATKQYNYPEKQEPELYQNTDHTAAADKSYETSHVKLNHEDNTITLKTSNIIGKDSLDDIQKQLDEAAKIQAEQVIARAQQEAQAQVEAQHKAIALAQIQAQKVALENIQKSIYGGAQALPLTQNTQEEYQAVTNNLGAVQHQSDVQLETANHNLPETSHDQIIHNPVPSTNALDNDISVKNLAVQSGIKSHVVSVPSGHRKTLYQNIPAHTFGSKEVLYYAPNHHHQVAAQLQAEKALLSQVQAQNLAIIRGHKHAPSAIRQILKKEEVSSVEEEDASNIHSVAESKQQATAYQQFILDSKEPEDGGEQKDYDDFDDLQYAAKYAFGYRIKDAKEGNDFGHEERRDGKSLEGSYHVLLPDGRLQKVEYYADNSGYHAKVTYEHLAHEETHA